MSGKRIFSMSAKEIERLRVLQRRVNGGLVTIGFLNTMVLPVRLVKNFRYPEVLWSF
jgi:hypothetical protein